MARNGAGGLDWSRSYLDRALVKKNLQICILPSPLPTYGRSCPSILEPPGSPITNQDQSYMILFILDSQIFSKTPLTCVQSGPEILESPGSHRITQDHSYMIFAFLAPHIFSKTPPYLCQVRSWDSRTTRIT